MGVISHQTTIDSNSIRTVVAITCTSSGKVLNLHLSQRSQSIKPQEFGTVIMKPQCADFGWDRTFDGFTED